MVFFNTTEPLLRSKQSELDIQDLYGLLRVRFALGNTTLLSHFYTRIDQVFLLWGLITLVIFGTAQFVAVSWDLQALLWSGLTVIGSIGMILLAWFWVNVERLCWLIYFWVGLMILGVALTDIGVFCSYSEILLRLCPLWLGIVAIGYLGMGVGMRSRTFCLMGVVHLSAIVLLPLVGGWQFLATGIVMGGSLFLLAGLQWDMRPPLESTQLTDEQRRFNRQQYRLRQLTARPRSGSSLANAAMPLTADPHS